MLGGLALFLPIPWLASYGAHVDFTASVLIVTAVVNLHHFMIDGVVWKLRDPRVSRALTTGAAARSRWASAPVAGATGRWRAAAIGVAVLAAGGAGGRSTSGAIAWSCASRIRRRWRPQCASTRTTPPRRAGCCGRW